MGRLKRPGLYLTILMLVSVFTLFNKLGDGSLNSFDEATYGLMAKNMYKTHEYFTPVKQIGTEMDYAGYALKPPFMYWNMIVSCRVFGFNELGVRFPTALYGLLAVALIYIMGATWFNKWVGIIAGFLLLTHFEFMTFARQGMMDVPMMLFISATLFCFWLARDNNGYYYLAGISLGVASLIKGMIGFLPLPIIGLYVLFTARHSIFREKHFWGMLIIAAIIWLPWHIQQYLAHGQEFIDQYFLYHFFKRFATSLEGHKESFWYYFAPLFSNWRIKHLGALLLPLIVWPIYRMYKKEHIEVDDKVKLLLAWFFVIFAVLSFASTKIHWYIIPAVFPLALLSAKWTFELNRLKWYRGFAVGLLMVALGNTLLLHNKGVFTADGNDGPKAFAGVIEPDSTVAFYKTPSDAYMFYSKHRVFPLKLESGGEMRKYYVLSQKKYAREVEQNILKSGLDIELERERGEFVLYKAGWKN